MNILVLLPDNFEEIEFITPVDLWRRAGYNVTTASITDDCCATGQQKISIQTDVCLKNINIKDFDYLFLPGGSGHKLLKESSLVTDTIQYFVDNNKTIIAICAAPTILVAWLQDKNATCYPSLKDLLPNFVDQNVVIDMPFVTSKGAGTAHELAFAVVSLISGEEASQKLRTTTIF